MTFFLSLFNCKGKKVETTHNLLKTQTLKNEQIDKLDTGVKRAVKSVNDTMFNKRINPPQTPYEEQVTQKSISVKLNHDDDTLKNVESLRPDNSAYNSKQAVPLGKEIKKL